MCLQYGHRLHSWLPSFFVWVVDLHLKHLPIAMHVSHKLFASAGSVDVHGRRVSNWGSEGGANIR